MSKIAKEIIREMVKEEKFQSADEVLDTLKEMFRDVLQEVLEAELEEKLGYDKYELSAKETASSRNGYSKKPVRSELGNIELNIPRDFSYALKQRKYLEHYLLDSRLEISNHRGLNAVSSLLSLTAKTSCSQLRPAALKQAPLYSTSLKLLKKMRWVPTNIYFVSLKTLPTGISEIILTIWNLFFRERLPLDLLTNNIGPLIWYNKPRRGNIV